MDPKITFEFREGIEWRICAVWKRDKNEALKLIFIVFPVTVKTITCREHPLVWQEQGFMCEPDEEAFLENV